MIITHSVVGTNLKNDRRSGKAGLCLFAIIKNAE
jgi:hypothetical protein